MKKYLLGLFAIALAVGFSAFTTAKKSSKMTKTTYVWVFDENNQGGDPTIAADAKDPLNYDKTATTSPTSPCTEVVVKVCGIYADEQSGNSNLPDITAGLQTEIDNFFAQTSSYPDVFKRLQ